MNPVYPILKLLFLAGILYLLYKALKLIPVGSEDTEESRRRKLAALAQKLQLQFNYKSDFNLAGHYLLQRSSDRNDGDYAYNVFCGRHLDYQITVFDYTFAAGKCNYYWSVYVLEMKTSFPNLMISPESKESRVAEALGEPHVTFEWAEFSKFFRVRSADKKFAFDVCHPQMMEFLLANKDLSLEIHGTALVLLFEDWLRPETMEGNLSRLVEIRKLLPQYLFVKN